MAQLVIKQPSRAAALTHRFAVCETSEGQWLVSAPQRGFSPMFPTQKAAVHFTLFELGQRLATALLTPRGAKPDAWQER